MFGRDVFIVTRGDGLEFFVSRETIESLVPIGQHKSFLVYDRSVTKDGGVTFIHHYRSWDNS